MSLTPPPLALAKTPTKPCVKFVLLGSVRAGMSVVQDAVAQHGRGMCLGPVLSGDAAVRERAQSAFFPLPQLGASELIPEFNAHRFLSHDLWWVAQTPELRENGKPSGRFSYGAFGFMLHYHDADRLDLWEYLDDNPDIKLIHVNRNPLCSFVSLQQAYRTGVWRRRRRRGTHLARASRHALPFCPVSFERPTLERFLKDTSLCQHRFRHRRGQVHEVAYSDMCIDYHAAIAGVFDFLGLAKLQTVPRTQKLHPGLVFEKAPLLKDYQPRLGREYQAYFRRDLI